jgi:N-acetylmuramoyl-L-alanine amidase
MPKKWKLTRRRVALLMGTALVGDVGFPDPALGADPAPGHRPLGRSPGGRVRPAVKPKARTIVIDPGHGGPDPGTIGISGFYEKNVVMVAARELARQLAVTGRYRPVLTRADDLFVALRDRVGRARSAKAELFISLHADAHPLRATRGASVYTLSEEASDREAAALAIKENKSDIIAGVDFRGKPPDVRSILIDLSQRETSNLSRLFAGMLVDSLAQHGILLLGRSRRHAGFAVLTAPDTPAVLLEMGYLSNPHDERLMVQTAHLRRLAQAAVGAVDRYFANRPAESPPATPSPVSASKKT